MSDGTYPEGAAAGSRSGYYADAATWAQDRNESLRRSRRIAWISAAVLALIALVEGLALMLMMPLKTVVPYTLLVDRQTGFVQAVDPLTPARVSGDTALIQSMLAQYVVGRESYDASTVRADYARVALWSGGAARSTYIAAMQPTNTASPIVRYGRSASVTTQIKSVSDLGRGSALVRFDTSVQRADGSVRPLGSWAAVIRYRLVGAPLRIEDRLANPLGFQVTRYRRDAEIVPPTPSAVVARPNDSGLSL